MPDDPYHPQPSYKPEPISYHPEPSYHEPKIGRVKIQVAFFFIFQVWKKNSSFKEDIKNTFHKTL